MNFQEIFTQFAKLQNPTKSPKMEAYMRNQFAFLGISAPERNTFEREIFQHLDKKIINWNLVFEAWENPYRESQYLAISYLKKMKKHLTFDDIPHLKRLITTKSWWDTIDSLDKIVGAIALRFPKTNAVLLEWSVDENFWLRRIAIDHQILRKGKTNTELLETILVNNFGSKEFFINKAIGWALRDFSKTNPLWVRNFLEKYSSEMSALSIREASKYI